MTVKEFKAGLKGLDNNREIVVQVYNGEYDRYDLCKVDFIWSSPDKSEKVVIHLIND